MERERVVLITCGIVAVSIIVVVYAWYQKSKREKFEDISDFMYSYVTEETPDVSAVVPARKPLPSRPCTLYYTNNIEFCNDNVNNWYSRSLSELRRYRDQLTAKKTRTSSENKQLAILKTVIAERESGVLPNGVCKVEFPGWIEHQVTAQGEPYPYKNKATFENENRMRPEDWAFCFKQGTDDKDAVALAKSFADEYVVKSFDTAGDYFQDGKPYGKIAFTTINLDDAIVAKAVARGDRATNVNSFICTTPPAVVSGVPSNMIAFDLNLDVIRSIYALRYNPDIQMFEVVSDPVAALRNMFDTQIMGRSLYLVPKQIQGTVRQIKFDVCGRVSEMMSQTAEFNMSLTRDLGMQPRLLYSSSSKDSPTYGTLNQLKDRANEIQNSIQTNQNAVQSLRSSINENVPKYARGHVRFTYKLMMRDRPSLANQIALDMIFDGTDPTSQSPNAVIEKREVIQGSPSERTYASDNSRIKYGYVLEGYINIGSRPAARYTFNINSDDGGDFVIDKTVVATHYNYHGMNDTGVKQTLRLESNKYYKFRARFAQWMGGSGVALQWKSGTQKTFTDIPADVLFFDENDSTRFEINNKQKEVATLTSSKALLDHTIDIIDNKINQFVELAFQNVANRKLTMNLENTSTDGRLYVDIGPLESSIGRSEEDALGQTIILEEPINVLAGSREYPSPVSKFGDFVQYSVSFWIYIGQTSPNWMNIFFHGVHDNWSLINGGDRTPGIWIIPRTSRIHFRQKSSDNVNDGCNTAEGLPMNTWVHFAAVVNGTNQTILDQPMQSIQLYVNGRKLSAGSANNNFKQLANNAVWHWGERSSKKARTGFSSPVAGKGVYVQKLYWYNRILGADEVFDIYQNSGVMRNKYTQCRTVETSPTDAFGWKTNAITNLNVKCADDETLSGFVLKDAGNNQSKYSYTCCKISSDDAISVANTTSQTSPSLYSDGSATVLDQHNINCQPNGINGFNVTANPSRDFMYFNFGCAETSSSTVNINKTCTQKSTDWVADDGTTRPLTSMNVACSDVEQLSRVQLVRDTDKKQMKYDFTCCEVGGL